MRSLLLAALVFVAACESPWAVELESPMPDVPAVYADWYQEVAACMGATQGATLARFERIQWYSAVDIYNMHDGVRALGLWTEPHRITLRSDRTLDQRVVKHELVHDLLRNGDHPPPHFERCAGV